MDAARMEIEALEAARARAIAAGDLDRLAAMVTGDYHHVDADGQIRDKAGYLAAIRSAAGRYLDYRLRDNRIEVSGTIAWVHGSFDNKFEAADGSLRCKVARHLRLYRFENGNWRNFYHQGTLIAAAE
ncbi:nuclear transport factor 2 family protein [Sphingopyxis sp. J-6]|uniref:nuclear transport factor 2 family protein n=1 Tax=Sphingopyxis sp. J-6 TaxID=3122054 RepID=UPI00398451F8